MITMSIPARLMDGVGVVDASMESLVEGDICAYTLKMHPYFFEVGKFIGKDSDYVVMESVFEPAERFTFHVRYIVIRVIPRHIASDIRNLEYPPPSPSISSMMDECPIVDVVVQRIATRDFEKTCKDPDRMMIQYKVPHHLPNLNTDGTIYVQYDVNGPMSIYFREAKREGGGRGGDRDESIVAIYRKSSQQSGGVACTTMSMLRRASRASS